ncbi:MAG: CDP-alcohol phosphatidyltransferase [Rhodospirillaceae bacterium]|nr:CDP-alcohol phosphatidyltransferase [Rhodospirillaceae bacterium]
MMFRASLSPHVIPPVAGGKTISHNTWIHKVARLTVTKPLMATGSRITPSQVTVVRMATGIAAAAAFSIGPSPWLDLPWWQIGAVLFILSMVLDRGDGDYARQSGQTSAAGHKFDLIADAVCNAIIFVGLGIGLRGGEWGMLAIPMGVLAGASVTFILWMVMRMESLAGARSAELGSFMGFDPDDAILVAPIMVLLGYQEALLVAATIGAPGFALLFAVQWGIKYRARRRALAEGGKPEE